MSQLTNAKRLERLLDHIASEGRASASDIIMILKYARELLEETADKSKPTLRFFCDWTLHPALDRNAVGHAKLAQAHDIISRDMLGGETIDYPLEISRALGISDLRMELRQLLKELHLPLLLIDDPVNWAGFMNTVFQELLNKPISLRAVPPGLDFRTGHISPYTLILVTQENDPNVYWVLETAPNMKMTGRLLNLDKD